MPRINVFISYADSFVGKRVLQQFQQFPATYHVYGCTWDSAAAEQLNAAATRSTAAPANGLHHTSSAVAEAFRGHEAADEAGHSVHLESRGTLSTFEVSRADTAPLHDDASRGTTAVAAALHGTAESSRVLSPTDAAQPAFASSASAASTFFPRHDVAATRAALLASDWIVVELRQAQTVLEVVQFLQLQTAFVRPKRLVLLSSLMTWYATPALSGANGSGGAAGDGAADEDGEGDREEDDDGPALQEDEEAEGGVAAPFPPPPPKSLEAIVQAAQDAARHAVVDAVRGGSTGDVAAGLSADGDADAAAADAADGESGAEVLTEDQYNRRVPHLHYMSWRDAEKAVAAAHHAKGLPLDTFVVCSGLPYGCEEDALEPLFRLAWSAQPEKAASAAAAVLPIFGDGSQRVPLVHAQDLACFVRKLLRCPTSSLPFPERRYLFATDGTNTNTWTSIVNGVNRMFGGRCALQPVPPSAYPLYRDVDRFTLNVRVEAESMKTLMERQEDAEPEAAAKKETTGAAARLPNTWVAEGGLSRHLRAVANEFAAARAVTPLRIALVGPPLVGKTYLATRVAQHYGLPCVSLASVVAEYTAALAALRSRAEMTKAAVVQAERTRRLALKRRRVLVRQQREWDAAAESTPRGAGAMGDVAGATAAAVAGEDDDEDGRDVSSNTDDGQGNNAVANAAAAAGAAAAHREVAADAFNLSPAEEEALTRFVDEWWAEQPQVQAWASKVAEMERVLLLRLHPRPPTPDANPKRRAGGGGAGGAGGGKKKTNAGKDAQKSKEEEEELQQLKASLQNAPFQARALTIMLRWRLAQPDCCVQGFVLDGVPATLELARMVFGEDNDEAVMPPATEEEALKPRYAGEGAAAAASGGGADGESKAEGGAAGPAAAKEVASDARLPDHVVVLQASDTYLLSRMRAMGVAAEQLMAGSGNSTGGGINNASLAEPPLASAAVDVETFQHDLQTYKREYEEATYSVLSYWECAAATATIEGITGPERRAEVHFVTVEGHEPLVPAPPPASAFAEVPIGDTEQLLRQVIIGPPHNFGKSLEEVQREAVRQRCLQEEEDRAHAEQVAAQAAAESTECAQEQQTRTTNEETLAALRAADLAELEARKKPMTCYLQERVLPLLHKGLLEVCAARPEDPVDFLAEWLIRHNPRDDTFSDI